MISPVFTLLAAIAVVLALSATVDAQRCRYTQDKLPGKIEKYNKCLSIGFDPSIEGCVKVIRVGHKLRKNDDRKCAELEKYLMKCGHTCALVEQPSVDGGWGDFGDWSECSAECDGGVQTRDRQCNNPAPDHGGADCEGEDSETQDCNTDPCPVDGGWGDFGYWSECSDECDGGVKTRDRQCNNPAPEHDGADCEGHAEEIQICNTHDCLECDDPNSDYNKCAASTCKKTCRENCEKPMVVHDNKFLSFDFGGEGECVQQCECHMGFVFHLGKCIEEQFCPVDGGWSDFGDWSECDLECGGGIQTRTRKCDNPAPEFGGVDCGADDEEMQQCNNDPCPVDGGWSDFGDWSECSDECDGGVQTREKQCNNPAPEHGGADCEGEAGEVQMCNMHDCLECDDPNSSYNKCGSSCMKTCSETCEGLGRREGECVQECECHRGFVLHLGKCTQQLFCPVDGGWSDFGDWSECDRECGGGILTRTRKCDNPAPEFGGVDCGADDEEMQPCNNDPCPVDGGWSDFGDWSECSAECDGGIQARVRQCDNPAPEHDGAYCKGRNQEMQSCNSDPCPVDGGWSDFGDWSECSAECDGGIQARVRQCDNPAPKHDGAYCEGRNQEMQACNSHHCPVDGGWSDFGDWSECSAECDGGIQARVRQCDNPAPEHDGAYCKGRNQEMQACNSDPCSVDGGWSNFGDWSECSAECGGGVQTRDRQCNNPAPDHGGADCEGGDSETQDCNTDECAVDGGWGEFEDWSECGAECGGSQSRSRECNNPTPAHDGEDCEGDAEETRDCPCKKLTSVYGMEAHDNIAASGTASQVNSAYKGFAYLAVDGDTNGDFEAGSVTHSRTSGEDVYWKLVFQSPQYIDSVVVWGRSDCCQRRIDGAKFCIDDVEMGELLSDQMSEDKEEFEVNSFGREILIKGPRGKLSLAEVEVFGMKFEFKNIADDADISAAEVSGGAVQREMSWDSPRHINSIVLNYKQNSSMEGFDGTRVYVGETEVGQVEAQDGKMVYIFGGLEGNHSQVRIVGSEAVMNLADVEIYGE